MTQEIESAVDMKWLLSRLCPKNMQQFARLILTMLFMSAFQCAQASDVSALQPGGYFETAIKRAEMFIFDKNDRVYSSRGLDKGKKRNFLGKSYLKNEMCIENVNALNVFGQGNNEIFSTGGKLLNGGGCGGSGRDIYLLSGDFYEFFFHDYPIAFVYYEYEGKNIFRKYIKNNRFRKMSIGRNGCHYYFKHDIKGNDIYYIGFPDSGPISPSTSPQTLECLIRVQMVIDGLGGGATLDFSKVFDRPIDATAMDVGPPGYRPYDHNTDTAFIDEHDRLLLELIVYADVLDYGWNDRATVMARMRASEKFRNGVRRIELYFCQPNCEPIPVPEVSPPSRP